MANAVVSQRSYLEGKFGSRVTFRETERKLYGHDIAAMPSLIKPLVGNTMPDAVVQPTVEEELVELVKWAADHNVPLTPRGKASSGYGGVIPVKKGVVVDFYRMNEVRPHRPGRPDRHRPGRHRLGEAGQGAGQAGPDPAALSRPATPPPRSAAGWPRAAPASAPTRPAGSGITWSAPGWCCLTATVKEFSGADLDLIADAEGITGLISEVTLRVQPLEKLEVMAIGCPDCPRPAEADAVHRRRRSCPSGR